MVVGTSSGSLTPVLVPPEREERELTLVPFPQLCQVNLGWESQLSSTLSSTPLYTARRLSLDQLMTDLRLYPLRVSLRVSCDFLNTAREGYELILDLCFACYFFSASVAAR